MQKRQYHKTSSYRGYNASGAYSHKKSTYGSYQNRTTELYDEENLPTQMTDLYDSHDRDAGIVDYERDNQAYQAVLRNELLHHIDNMMQQQLTEREQSIVERYFGIGCTAHRPSRIAQDFDMTVSEVEALVKLAIVKLRECDYAIYLWQYLHGKKI